ncbi:MAG: oligopeptidase B, partial [Acidimicrobiia bacterium]
MTSAPPTATGADGGAGSPPVAKRVPTTRSRHGDTTVDEYAWLRDRDDPDTVAYLEAENAHTEASLARLAPLREELFQEIRGRIQETDLSVPTRRRGWWYYSRTEEGRQYPTHCRKRASEADDGPDGRAHRPAEGTPEEIVLDVGAEAGEADFFSLGTLDVSPDGSLLAWSSDRAGAEVYELRFRDLASGTDLDDVVAGTYYGSAWAADGRTFFYVRPDEAMRPHQLWRHVLGTDPATDVLVHQEDDERFHLGVGTTKDERFVLVHLGSKVTDEVRFLDAADPTGPLRVVQAREQDLEYGVEHHSGRFFIVTNADGAEDFKLVSAPVEEPGRDSWTEVVPHRPGVKLSGIDVFVDHLVLFERADGTRRIRVLHLAGGLPDGDEHVIEQPEAVSTSG